MFPFEKLNAIRRMLNAPEGQTVTLSTSEIIEAWNLIDECGDTVGMEEISTEMILRCYERHQEWSCPDENQ